MPLGSASARAEVDGKQGKATSELAVARANLSALDPATTATPLADRLGVQGWLLDLIASALGSVAANGLAACLIAFGGHKWVPRAITVEPLANRGSGRVDAFAAAVLHPRDGGRVTLGKAYVSYQRWCERAGLDPLPPLDFADAFAELVERLGAPVRLSDGVAEVLDVSIESLAIMSSA